MDEKKSIPCEVYSRIVGYFRPVRNWNKGKRQEFQDRKVYEFPTDKLEPVTANADKRTEQNLAH
jgi:hypothetical protein